MATRNTVKNRRKPSRGGAPISVPEVRLVISNRQRDRKVDTRALRSLVETVQAEAGQSGDERQRGGGEAGGFEERAAMEGVHGCFFVVLADFSVVCRAETVAMSTSSF